MRRRVATMAAMLGRPNHRRAGRLMSGERRLAREAMAAVVPTTKRLWAVASTGENRNRRTRSGTVRMEPPEPVSPRMRPMNTAPR